MSSIYTISCIKASTETLWWAQGTNVAIMPVGTCEKCYTATMNMLKSLGSHYAVCQ